jgi:hypothetical protein
MSPVPQGTAEPVCCCVRKEFFPLVGEADPSQGDHDGEAGLFTSSTSTRRIRLALRQLIFDFCLMFPPGEKTLDSLVR